MDEVRIIARAGTDRLGEGPLWSARDDALYWVDIIGQRVNRLRLDGEAVDTWDMPELVGWVIERTGGGFVAGFRSGFVALELDPLGVTPLYNPEPHRPGNRLNDAKADAGGTIWAGSMHMDGSGGKGALYRLSPDLRCELVDDGYGIANGPAFSRDHRWLYHTDSKSRVIYRFALHPDGAVGERVPFISFPEGWGSPDGMTVDADDHLWVARWGAGCISRFAPDGGCVRTIRFPATQITSCSFAGRDLDRMFVTSAAEGVSEPLGGALFEIDPGCRGLPTYQFSG
jgi:sugar lactone lactonase YvrE